MFHDNDNDTMYIIAKAMNGYNRIAVFRRNGSAVKDEGIKFQGQVRGCYNCNYFRVYTVVNGVWYFS